MLKAFKQHEVLVLEPALKQKDRASRKGGDSNGGAGNSSGSPF